MSDRPEICRQITQVMEDGGYLDTILSGGPELNRVKAYLLAFAGRQETDCVYPLQYPSYPCFPGLRHEPFREAGAMPGVAVLEDAFTTIRDEYLALKDDDLLIYTPPSMTNLWAVYLFSYMGVDLELLTRHCPRTHEILRGLPRVCLDYPWGDALFSIHASDSHLKPHCSIDNLRVRCHLGIQIPEGCRIRVGTETRTWEEGKGMLFEDSFEHEVWNHGTSRRAILIVDFWHPDLTDIEIRALTAGFRKSEVRRIFLLDRINMLARVPRDQVDYLEAALPGQDDDPFVREFWKR